MIATQTASPNSPEELEQCVVRVKEGAPRFARLPLHERLKLLDELIRGMVEVSSELVAASCQAKGIRPGSAAEGDEWLGGPFSVLRYLRLLRESLRDIQETGAPRVDLSSARTLSDGRLALRVFPPNALEAALLAKTTAEVHLEPGVGQMEARARQAKFYQSPHSGRVCAVLGAGNVNCIPAVDSLQKLFIDGAVVVLKMNPVNAYAGPFLERAFRPLIERGFFGVVYGGAEEGAFLVQHRLVDELHMTGSDQTHDAIVWGPSGPERALRKQRGEPLWSKPVTSELGNVTPFIVVPGPYTAKELAWQAASIAGMLGYNAGFNCNSPRLLVTWAGWERRRELLDALTAGLQKAEVRRAYYPGAEERWALWTAERANLRIIGEGAPGHTPFALITDVDPSRPDDRVFRAESWCSAMAETALQADDPLGFLEAAVQFVNQHVWGNLSVGLVVHPRTLEDRAAAERVERCIQALRYGTVTVNSSPIAGFGLMTTPWGGHPSNTLADIQSGLGWGHNSLMLEGVEKCVIRGPLMTTPPPPWWPGHRRRRELGQRLTRFEQEPSWLKVPSLAAAALGA